MLCIYKWDLLVVFDWIAEDETIILIKFWYAFSQRVLCKFVKKDIHCRLSWSLNIGLIIPTTSMWMSPFYV